MAADIERLIVELDAKVDGYIKGQEKIRDENNKSNESVRELGLRIAAMAAAASAAITATAIEAANFARELQVAANRAGETVENMQALAFASNTVGISLENLGDIAKDTNEKVGEFLATGGGGFMDFVDVMGLSESRARAVAEEFENLSGPQVLQRMVMMMEEANISTERMSFALEGMASDATDLIPLLRNNAEGLNRLRGEFDALGATLSSEDIQNLQSVNEEMSKFQQTLSAESRSAIAQYSEELEKAIQVTLALTTATIDLVQFFINGWTGVVSVTNAAINDIANGTNTLPQVMERAATRSREAFERVFGSEGDALEVRVTGGVLADDELTDDSPFIQRLAMEEEFQEKLQDLRLQGDETETERIQKELALLDEMFAAKLIKEKDFQDARVQVGVDASKRILDAERQEEQQTARSEQFKLNTRQNAIRAGMAVNQAFFDDNKAINAGLIIADTATGIQKSLAINPYDWVNPAIIAATGAANLANALGASKGGGSISGASGPGGPLPIVNQPEDFAPETTGLEVTEQGDSSASTVRVIIGTDDGNDLIDTIGEQLITAQNEGRVG